ncbi:MAG: PPC domain-containing protein [Aggregatilineales bacterium]
MTTRHICKGFVVMLALAALGAALPALAQAATPISIGDTVEGSLTAAQPQARYTFTGEAGQLVTITLVSNAFDAYLTLEDANGMFIAEDDDSAGERNARIGPLALPANGSFVIIASSLFGGETGAYSLTLAAPQAQTLTLGDVVESELTADELTKTFFLEAEAGDTVAITLRSDAFDAYLELRSSSGGYSWTDDDSAGNYNSLIGPLELPESGTYIVTATSLGGTSTGPFTLALDKAQITALTLDTPVQVNLAAGEPLYLAFEGVSGQTIGLRVDSGNTIDTLLILREPEGYQIGYSDDLVGVDPALLATNLPSTGTYIAIIRGQHAKESGPLTVTLTNVPLPSLDEGPQRLGISDKQNTGQVVFDGVAGETVTLTLALESGASLPSYLEIRQRNELLVATSSYALTATTLTLLVPRDGVVLVKLTDYSSSTKVVTLALERAAAN